MSVLSWHFLVMPKIVSHPGFSPELDNIFPMLNPWVLHLLTISSSLGCKTQFSVHSAGQTWFSILCLDPMAYGRGGFPPLCCSHPSGSLSFYPASIGHGAVCISLTLLPRQGFSLARSSHRGSLHRIFDRVCLALPASDTLF